jgi:transcriptional regulator with XRE-family HTH domain
MSTADTPAVARRRVRLALRAAREAKGLTQGQVADEMEWSLSKVMRIEKGDVNISPADLRVLLGYFDLTDPN